DNGELSMNLAHLELFHAVAAAGNVSKAADKIGVSQPAVSKQVKSLETAIGMPLFDRIPRGVRLTAAGEVLQGFAHRIFSLTRDAEDAMAEMRGLRRGTLAIGASTTIGVYILPDVLVRFRQQ